MEQAIADVLRARRIELIDARGIVRATLSTTIEPDDESVTLTLLDDRGREHLSLTVDADAAAVELVEDGNALAVLSSTRGGHAALTLFNESVEPVRVVDNAGEAA
jgi:hypothetical protein